jgi:anhydro-N-acetylmuramic acid kinase
VATALTQLGLSTAEIDLIGSHGQTIWHDVADGHVTSTLQIGEPAVIAARTGVTTVANFRVADVAEGGQGAPLVSAFDWHLLRPAPALGGWRAVQNIGGIGNVTFLPPHGDATPPLAFDTGPGNALIDWAAGAATGGAWTYDQEGELASEGRVIAPLLAEWLAHPFFAAPPPKTTGRELYTTELARSWQAAVAAQGGTPLDLVATLTELTAAAIADAYARFAPGAVVEVVVGGGGARNPALMAALARQLAARLGWPVALTTHEALGIDSDAKEALAFALLAYLCWHGWPGNVPACTGAHRPALLGQITPGRNFREIRV